MKINIIKIYKLNMQIDRININTLLHVAHMHKTIMKSHNYKHDENHIINII